MNWAGTVYHGLPPGLYSIGSGEGGYFLFLAAYRPRSALSRAIFVARQRGVPLYIEAKIDEADPAYFSQVIKHWQEPFGIVMIEAFACGTPSVLIDATQRPRRHRFPGRQSRRGGQGCPVYRFDRQEALPGSIRRAFHCRADVCGIYTRL